MLALSQATCQGLSADFAQARTRSMTVEAAPTGTAMRAVHRPLRRQPARGRRKLRLNVCRALRKGRRGRSERDAGARVPEPERSQAIKRPVPTDMLARCMLAGRTLSVLQSLERSSLFRTESSTGATTAALQPAVGVAASLGNSSVVVLQTFRRHGRCKAHVVPVVPTKRKRPPHGATHVLNRRRGQTCDSDQLRDVACLGRSWAMCGTPFICRSSPSGCDSFSGS